MTEVLRLQLTIILLTISTLTFGRVGLADWSAITPHGNEINNFTEYTLYLKNRTHLDGLGEWYFYKDCIIGRLRGNSVGDTIGYFVVNELSFQIDTFKTKSEWTTFLKDKNLQPKVWTRWYQDDWSTFHEGLFFFYYFFFIISIPLTILFLFMIYKAIRKEKLSFRRPYTIIVTIVIGLILISWLSEQFPQSI